MKFESLNSEQRFGIINNRTATTLTVDKTTVGINGCVSNPILTTHVELPPSPVILTEEAVAQIFVYSGNGTIGAWERFFVMVYFNGGRIFFKELNKSELEVVIQFL